MNEEQQHYELTDTMRRAIVDSVEKGEITITDVIISLTGSKNKL